MQMQHLSTPYTYNLWLSCHAQLQHNSSSSLLPSHLRCLHPCARLALPSTRCSAECCGGLLRKSHADSANLRSSAESGRWNCDALEALKHCSSRTPCLLPTAPKATHSTKETLHTHTCFAVKLLHQQPHCCGTTPTRQASTTHDST
jgi:hypothetical protein